MLRQMRSPLLSFLTAAICLGLTAAPGAAKTITVVTFNSEEGIIMLDSIKSMLPYRLFETLDARVKNDFLTQSKVYHAAGNEFRIACAGLSLDYTCAVFVYAGPHADLDFDTDMIRMRLPIETSARYAADLSPDGEPLEIVSEDGRFALTWSEGKPLTITGLPPGDRAGPN